MTITLSPEQQRLVAQAMQNGGYREAVSAKIERAFEQFERGQFYTDRQARADLEQRKAAWLCGQQRWTASLYYISAAAQNDLFEIWQRIAADSVDLANRIEDGFHALFASLARRNKGLSART